MRLVQSLALAAIAITPLGAEAQSGSRGGFAPAPAASFGGAAPAPVTAFAPTVGAAPACCGQPTVAFAPVVPQVAAAPVVQQTTFTNGWYPGKYLRDFTRSVFGLNRTTTTYTAGYAPYTAGFAPTFAARTAYRPVYPATFGPVVPFTQTVSRPVVLSPVVSAPACGPCNAVVASPCDCCGVACAGGNCGSCGVTQAGFDSPAGGFEQRPQLAPGDSVPPVRGERSIRQRQELNDFPPLPNDIEEDRPQGEPAATNSYWGAPPLFAPPTNRVTRNTHPAPVHTAVYKQAPAVQPTAYRPAASGRVNRLSADSWSAATPRTGKVNRLSADGWVAAE